MTQQQLREFMSTMTLQEKIGQLIQLSGEFFGEGNLSTGPQEKLGIEEWVSQNAGSVLNVMGAEKVTEIQKRHMEHSRIPLLFMADIVYGYKTVYPVPLAMACSWDPDMVKQCMRYTSMEAVPDGAHVTFAPMVDVVRDARWGRCLESPGEDPYLNGVFAKAMVEGFQGIGTEKEASDRMSSCVKHFAGYGAVEAGREYNTVDMSAWRLIQEYLPPYKSAVEAGCDMVMTSFNTIEGIPATANQWLMKEILRKQWGFDGVIITDYAAIQELIAHGVAADNHEAACLAMNASVDIDMKTPCYATQLQPLLEEGRLSIKKIDEAVWRVLSLKNKIGLFENPFKGIDPDLAEKRRGNEKFLAQARTMAEQSIVLLKNGNNVLPLKKQQKIALIGPYADNCDLMGLWAVYGDKSKVVTLKEAMEGYLGDRKDHLRVEQGCNLMDDASQLGEFGGLGLMEHTVNDPSDDRLDRAIELAKWADVVVFALGEHTFQSGESGSRTVLEIPDSQKRFMDAVIPYAKKTVTLLFNGRPLVLTHIMEKTDALLECWFPGTEGSRAITNILYGEVNPSGRLTMSFPYAVGQIPIYYSAFRTGRPAGHSQHSGRFVSRYLDCPNEPLFPFGYGLSYHETEYGEIELDQKHMNSGEQIHATIQITNKSDRSGLETVQLYLRDVSASVVRPLKELKAFQKIALAPKETKRITFVIEEDMLKFHDQTLEWISETGNFELYIGKNSSDCKKTDFQYSLIRTEETKNSL